MDIGLTPLQIAYALTILSVFIAYGSFVRRGILKGTAIIWAGVPVGFLAVAASIADLLPAYRAGMPIIFLLINGLLMTLLTVFCVGYSYRSQRVTDIAVFLLGDTKIIVRVCGPANIPETDALILPTSTALRLSDGLAPILSTTVGPSVAAELRKISPVGMGKVVATGSGNLSVGLIFHVAVSDSGRPVDALRLRKGVEAAAQQARKAHAESLSVPVGPLRGLPFAAATEATVTAVLRQRRAFAEIVVVVFEARFGATVAGIVEQAVRLEESNVASGRPGPV